jgi:hypothetical protein
MKKLLYVIATFLFVATLVSPASAGSILGSPQGDSPAPGWPEDQPVLFLPAVMYQRTFNVTGQIKDMYDMPVSGVTVSSDSGQTTVTDANGVYDFYVADGQRQISASKEGYEMEPGTSALNVSQDIHNLSFTAISACYTPIPNPGFEVRNYYWNPISGNANGFTPYYTTAKFNAGTQSGYTGIPNSNPPSNKVSWSRWRTHEFVIPSDAASADVSMFVWPQTTESVVLAREGAPRAVGFDTESPDAPYFPGDMHYVAVINTNNQIIGYVWDVRWNDQAWITTGVLDLMPYAGREVKLEFGTYNDGVGGVTSAYFDDVVINVCADSILFSGCQNLLVNSDFEAAGSWTISPANIPSAYSPDYYFSPVQSMLSGVPVGIANPFPHEFTTSEFWQPTTTIIPSNANYARLKVRLLPRSSDLWGYHLAEQAAMDSLDWTSAPDAVESQYGHVRDVGNTTTLRQLFKWFPVDSYNWLYREYDLLDYRGQTISILFGASNDGWDGNTALYVDDVVLEACAP